MKAILLNYDRLPEGKEGYIYLEHKEEFCRIDNDFRIEPHKGTDVIYFYYKGNLVHKDFDLTELEIYTDQELNPEDYL
ncbi:MAG: hypothetical protein KAI79_09845 [Bacteroidales bacterium]|nr:hypothetical protein [Bacteroidales bacterium]